MNSNFHTTRWTLILESHGEGEIAKRALSELCNIYYQPVRDFVFHQVANKQNVDDLTHSFFEQLLENNSLQNVDMNKGKFRTYLLASVKNFIYLQHNKLNAQKRGGSVTVVNIDDLDLPINDQSIHRDFDRKWADAIITNALTILESQMKQEGKQKQFQILQPWLDGVTQISTETTADQLNLSISATKVTIHRLRKRFRSLVRAEVTSTLPAGASVTEELNHLIKTLSKPS